MERRKSIVNSNIPSVLGSSGKVLSASIYFMYVVKTKTYTKFYTLPKKELKNRKLNKQTKKQTKNWDRITNKLSKSIHRNVYLISLWAKHDQGIQIFN